MMRKKDGCDEREKAQATPGILYGCLVAILFEQVIVLSDNCAMPGFSSSHDVHCLHVANTCLHQSKPGGVHSDSVTAFCIGMAPTMQWMISQICAMVPTGKDAWSSWFR